MIEAIIMKKIEDLKQSYNTWKNDWTQARAAKLDNLDAAVSSRASAADYTPARATKLDRLDTTISSRASATDVQNLATAANDLAGVVAKEDSVNTKIAALSSQLAQVSARVEKLDVGRYKLQTGKGFYDSAMNAISAIPSFDNANFSEVLSITGKGSFYSLHAILEAPNSVRRYIYIKIVIDGREYNLGFSNDYEYGTYYNNKDQVFVGPINAIPSVINASYPNENNFLYAFSESRDANKVVKSFQDAGLTQYTSAIGNLWHGYGYFGDYGIPFSHSLRILASAGRSKNYNTSTTYAFKLAFNAGVEV